MDYLEHYKNDTEIAKAFGISRNTLYQWKTKKETTAQIKHSSGGLPHMKIDREKLSAYVGKRLDAYLHEIASKFNCSVSAVFYALRALGFTYKKRPRAIKNKIAKNSSNIYSGFSLKLHEAC